MDYEGTASGNKWKWSGQAWVGVCGWLEWGLGVYFLVGGTTSMMVGGGPVGLVPIGVALMFGLFGVAMFSSVGQLPRVPWLGGILVLSAIYHAAMGVLLVFGTNSLPMGVIFLGLLGGQFAAIRESGRVAAEKQ